MKKRWVGPIPTIFCEADDASPPKDVYYHPGGPCPAWGGYKPVRSDMDWDEFCRLAGEGRTAKLWDDLWLAHAAETRLRFAPEGWYVETPADRLAWRCVSITMDALRSGIKEQELLAIGISEEEITKARIRRDAKGISTRRLMDANLEVQVCVNDSLETGNCLLGTTEFFKKYGLREHVYIRELLENKSIEEMLKNFYFREVICYKLVGFQKGATFL